MLPLTDAGEGPAIVLLHAGIADRRMWDDELPLLAAAGYRVIALDLPGFGEAPVRAGLQLPWVDVLTTLDELGVASAVLVGCSFGAAVALRAAITMPARFRRLVLASPPPLGGGQPSAPLAAAWEAEEAALARGDLSGAVDAVLDAWLLPGAPPALRERIGAMQRRAFELQAEADDAADAIDPAEQPGALDTLTMPVLVTAGPHDFEDFTAGAAHLVAALPNARLEMIPGTGHLAPLERPADFRELLLGVIAEPAG